MDQNFLGLLYYLTQIQQYFFKQKIGNHSSLCHAVSFMVLPIISDYIFTKDINYVEDILKRGIDMIIGGLL